MNSNTTGIATNSDIAAKSPQAESVAEIYEASPTGSVNMSSLVLKVSANRNSFQATRNENNPVTATAGRLKGNIIR